MWTPTQAGGIKEETLGTAATPERGCSVDKYRIFVSYCHEDQKLRARLTKALDQLGFGVLCDRNIDVGMPFTDAIKGLITHAHVFMPLITLNAQKRPWVHQETGYAMALNIPILPIVTANAGLPGEMIAQLQAVCVKDDLSAVAKRLREANVLRLLVPRSALPQDMIRVAGWPEERTEWLAQHADRVAELGSHGMMRQRGALSSFCLPDKDIDDAIWRERDGRVPRSDYYHYLQREERRALERHARAEGCRLVIFPPIDLGARGERVRLVRLRTLLEFLESMPDGKAQVVTSERALGGNLTIVGNWFVAESLVPKPGGYLQTVFNWHAPTVSLAAKRFDDEFMDLCAEARVKPEKSRGPAIEAIKAVIGQDEKDFGTGDHQRAGRREATRPGRKRPP